MKNLRYLTVRLATATALYVSLGGGTVFAAEKETLANTTTWGGIGFGIGIAADFNLSRSRRLGGDTSAVVVPADPGGIVRISEARDVGVSLVLEAHYFLREHLLGGFKNCPDVRNVRKLEKGTPATDYWLNCTELAHGPFVAIEIGGGQSSDIAKGPITAYALGWMLGMRHPNLATPSNVSWNFGVGFRIEPGAKFLGEGIVANQPLPLGESATVVRTRRDTAYGVMLLSSFAFNSGP